MYSHSLCQLVHQNSGFWNGICRVYALHDALLKVLDGAHAMQTQQDMYRTILPACTLELARLHSAKA